MTAADDLAQGTAAGAARGESHSADLVEDSALLSRMEKWAILRGRGKRTLAQFIKFGLVGGSGVIVNSFMMFICLRVAGVVEISEHDALFNLAGTQFNVRWYHLFTAVAFLVANLWNFQLNRMWTFKRRGTHRWFQEFGSFLLVGTASFIITLVITTVLMNPASPLALPSDIFDDSSGLRRKLYWANAIGVVVAMPVNFLVNKLWTFRAVHRHQVEEELEEGLAGPAAGKRD